MANYASYHGIAIRFFLSLFQLNLFFMKCPFCQILAFFMFTQNNRTQDRITNSSKRRCIAAQDLHHPIPPSTVLSKSTSRYGYAEFQTPHCTTQCRRRSFLVMNSQRRLVTIAEAAAPRGSLQLRSSFPHTKLENTSGEKGA